MKNLAILLLLSGCSVLGPTPDESVPSWVTREWVIGQDRLIENYCYPEHVVKSVLPINFAWEYKPDVFKCGKKKANGCFSTPRTITVNLQTKNVVRHEAQHAILYVLGYRPEWKKAEHDSDFRGLCQ